MTNATTPAPDEFVALETAAGLLDAHAADLDAWNRARSAAIGQLGRKPSVEEAEQGRRTRAAWIALRAELKARFDVFAGRIDSDDQRFKLYAMLESGHPVAVAEARAVMNSLRPKLLAANGLAKTRRANMAEANVKADDYLRRHPESKLRQLAKAINCSTGLACQLPAWKAVRRARLEGRVPKSVRTQSFTSRTEAVVGQRDAKLAELIGEQERDERSDHSGSIRGRTRPRK